MGNAWFETVAEAQRRARKRLPTSVYGALIAGSEKGLTVRDNVEAFSELGFAPHVAGLPGNRDLATTVLGQQVSLAAARTFGGRLVTQFGEPLETPDHRLTHLFPTPEALAEADLGPVGLTRRQ